MTTTEVPVETCARFVFYCNIITSLRLQQSLDLDLRSWFDKRSVHQPYFNSVK